MGSRAAARTDRLTLAVAVAVTLSVTVTGTGPRPTGSRTGTCTGSAATATGTSTSTATHAAPITRTDVARRRPGQPVTEPAAYFQRLRYDVGIEPLPRYSRADPALTMGPSDAALAHTGACARTSLVMRRSTTKDRNGTVPASMTSSIRRTDQPTRRPRSATVSR